MKVRQVAVYSVSYCSYPHWWIQACIIKPVDCCKMYVQAIKMHLCSN